jgi:UDP:flavonoid glycosyltransferase YjiC (YdhE family)
MALTAAGADVVLACPGEAGAAVAEHCEVRRVEPVEVEVPAFPAEADRDGRFLFAVTRRWPAIARAWASALLREAEVLRPDVIVVEPTEHAGRVVAAILGVPWVEHGWGFTLPAGAATEATASITDLYESLGSSPHPPAMRVDLGPDRLQAADAEKAARFRYRTWSPGSTVNLPEPKDRGRILVTLGTFPNPDAASRLATAARAAAASGAETVVVLGNRDAGAQTWPEGVVVVPWVDTAHEVTRCDLVVHHAGAGTAYACVLAGVPALCLPQMGDQFRNAGLLADADTCLVSSPEDAHEAHLTALMHQALADRQLAEAARAARHQNAQLPDVESLAHSVLAAAA